ncbi:DUF6778 family protein [Yoonia sp. SS1-5]|uniref:DUF6778 family protein n=1 Tax=Yoonia rhodophyticola TaxID=3137370 RepID=A0AAN0NHF7_9RHOB
MAKKRLLGFFVVLFGLAACTGQNTLGSGPPEGVTRNYALQDVRFSAPSELTVSEAESYYPIADVIWRGDPRGDRVQQISAMFETAEQRAKPSLRGAIPVVADVQLERFHGVTNRTRYSIGGVYNVIFDLTLRNARTGEVIEPRRRIVANLDAPGGDEAVTLEQSGQTQKVRVTDFLTQILVQELT